MNALPPVVHPRPFVYGRYTVHLHTHFALTDEEARLILRHLLRRARLPRHSGRPLLRLAWEGDRAALQGLQELADAARALAESLPRLDLAGRSRRPGHR